ncbi:MAG: hypothetical protein F6J93_23875 [Oscillatoria sp. SIO1A7]|nr:hypothetical protein [Oscillatoria sp. SIO1A7]
MPRILVVPDNLLAGDGAMAIALCNIRLYDSGKATEAAENKKKFLQPMLFFDKNRAIILLMLP